MVLTSWSSVQCVNSIIISGGMAPGYNCVNSVSTPRVVRGEVLTVCAG